MSCGSAWEGSRFAIEGNRADARDRGSHAALKDRRTAERSGGMAADLQLSCHPRSPRLVDAGQIKDERGHVIDLIRPAMNQGQGAAWQRRTRRCRLYRPLEAARDPRGHLLVANRVVAVARTEKGGDNATVGHDARNGTRIEQIVDDGIAGTRQFVAM